MVLSLRVPQGAYKALVASLFIARRPYTPALAPAFSP
jgi:hypothetical protein